MTHVKDVSAIVHAKGECYDPSEQKWFKQCCVGQLMLPEDENMGKIYLEGHGPYNETIYTWFYEATDVIHVMENEDN